MFAHARSELCAGPAAHAKLSLTLSASSAPWPSRPQALAAPAKAASKVAMTSLPKPAGPPQHHDPGGFQLWLEDPQAEKAAFRDSLRCFRQPQDTIDRGDLVPFEHSLEKRRQVLEKPDPAALKGPGNTAAEMQQPPAPAGSHRAAASKQYAQPEQRAAGHPLRSSDRHQTFLPP